MQEAQNVRNFPHVIEKTRSKNFVTAGQRGPPPSMDVKSDSQPIRTKARNPAEPCDVGFAAGIVATVRMATGSGNLAGTGPGTPGRKSPDVLKQNTCGKYQNVLVLT
jgi:hypothetical protein